MLPCSLLYELSKLKSLIIPIHPYRRRHDRPIEKTYGDCVFLRMLETSYRTNNENSESGKPYYYSIVKNLD